MRPLIEGFASDVLFFLKGGFSMTNVILTSSDRHEFGAYRADPDGAPRGAIVVIQEIFGVNTHIRSICDRLAVFGYVAIAPTLFDRIERDFQSGYSPEEVTRAREFIPSADRDGFVRDVDAARAAVSDARKVGVVGFVLAGPSRSWRVPDLKVFRLHPVLWWPCCSCWP